MNTHNQKEKKKGLDTSLGFKTMQRKGVHGSVLFNFFFQ